MNVYITSFFQTSKLPEDLEVWSAAVYQPKGYKLPKADWTDIRNETGEWTRPRNFVDEDEPLVGYHQTLLNIYHSRLDDVKTWIDEREGDAALCCWCPYDRAAKRQLKEFGSFVCHTAVLGEVLTELGVHVWYDADRLHMKGLP